MTDYDVIRWTALVWITWRGCGIAWKLLAAQAERVRVWYNEGEQARHSW